MHLAQPLRLDKHFKAVYQVCQYGPVASYWHCKPLCLEGTLSSGCHFWYECRFLSHHYTSIGCHRVQKYRFRIRCPVRRWGQAMLLHKHWVCLKQPTKPSVVHCKLSCSCLQNWASTNAGGKGSQGSMRCLLRHPVTADCCLVNTSADLQFLGYVHLCFRGILPLATTETMDHQHASATS